jgi:hypothetical protein
MLKGNPLTNISMEQIIDCDGTTDPVDKHADCGVYGGWPFLAFEYVMRAVIKFFFSISSSFQSGKILKSWWDPKC